MAMYQASVIPVGAASDRLLLTPKTWLKPSPVARDQKASGPMSQSTLAVPVDPLKGSNLDIYV